MSRTTQILQQLELTHTASVTGLARLHGVGERTIVREVATINERLGASGAIREVSGGFRLVVVNPEEYKARKHEMERADSSFNEPPERVRYILARLFRAETPVPIEALAQQMSVSRSTAIADLARAREQAAAAGLQIVGRPKVGLTLEGTELAQRLAVLRSAFERAYSGESAPVEVVRIVTDFAAEQHLTAFSRDELLRWVMVAVDRVRGGHLVTELPAQYAELAQAPGRGAAQELTVRLGGVTGVAFTDEEVLFLTLPLAGMRTPEDVWALTEAPRAELKALIEDIVSAVRDEMNIRIASDDLLTEFAYHLGYMLDRTRYQIWIHDTGVTNIAEEYPVAHHMARIAARVIAERMGLQASESEVAFLAAYFGVFLESLRARSGHRTLQVAIVSGSGRVTARLIEAQLRRLMPSASIRTSVLVDDAANDPEALAGVDLVITTQGVEVATEAPVIELAHVFDRHTLAGELGQLRLRLPGEPHLMLAAGLSPLAAALDAEHFFVLPSGTSYPEALSTISTNLERAGLVEAGFTARLLEREQRATMRLDPWVAFPHLVMRQGTQVVLAVGLIRQPDTSDEVRIVVMMGLPVDLTDAEPLLIAAYEEIIRLAGRRDVVTRLSRLTTYEDFFYYMDRIANQEH